MSGRETGSTRLDARPRKRERIAAQLLAAFRSGSVPTDVAFDRVLSRRLRLASPTHWTPTEVITRVAKWLDQYDIRTLVDVGAGAGKVCIVGALITGRRFVGIEQRRWLVREATTLARLMEVADHVELQHAVFGEDELPRGDAYYFFNPFGESLLDDEDALGADVELSVERRLRDIASARALMRTLPEGTFILTYNGFGGRMPTGYRAVDEDFELPNVLRLWRKESDRSNGSTRDHETSPHLASP